MHIIHVNIQPSPGYDLEDPTDWDLWEVVSFNRNDKHYKPLDSYFDHHGTPRNIGLQSRLRHGTAFLLSAYMHSSVHWSLQNEGYSCPFDSIKCAGLLLLKEKGGIKPGLDNRREAARQFLRLYTDWCNGSGWDATVRVHEIVNDNDLTWQELMDNGDLRVLREYHCSSFYASDTAGLVEAIAHQIEADVVDHGPPMEIVVETDYLDIEDEIRKHLTATAEAGQKVLDSLPHHDQWALKFALKWSEK